MLFLVIEYTIFVGLLLFAMYIADSVTEDLLRPYMKDYTDKEINGAAYFINAIIMIILLFIFKDEFDKLTFAIIRALFS